MRTSSFSRLLMITAVLLAANAVLWFARGRPRLVGIAVVESVEEYLERKKSGEVVNSSFFSICPESHYSLSPQMKARVQDQLLDAGMNLLPVNEIVPSGYQAVSLCVSQDFNILFLGQLEESHGFGGSRAQGYREVRVFVGGVWIKLFRYGYFTGRGVG